MPKHFPKFLVLLAILYLLGCSRSDAIRAARVAATGGLAAAQRAAAEKAAGYALNPKALERDLKNFQSLLEEFRDLISGVWGDDEVREPGPRQYVKYTQNYRCRARVDFDAGIATVETVDEKNPLKSLRTAIVTTVLTPEDPRAVDLYSAKPVKLGGEPFLHGLVRDFDGKAIRWQWRAGRFADGLMEKRLRQRAIRRGVEQKTVRFVTFSLASDRFHLQAAKYKKPVERFSARYGVSRNLVYAIIQTESDFNPFAVSRAPAFGLMQIVPGTAGSDVHRYLYKKSGSPSRRELMVPETNILYGTTYLHMLQDRYLEKIQDPISKEYCVIAAYNAGAGSVLRTFHTDRDRAPERINAISPLEVYRTLRERLPSAEGRRYLAKVMEAKKDFVKF